MKLPYDIEVSADDSYANAPTSYTKVVVCLAKSRMHSESCFAGKELSAKEWIRPTSKRPTLGISESESRYANGTQPRLLDKISIPFIKPKPWYYQSENHLIDDKERWSKEGAISWNDLTLMLDPVADSLWINGHGSYNGMNDRVPETDAYHLGGSLLLIHPDHISLTVTNELNGRRVRAKFCLNDIHYQLSVTDPAIERNYMAKGDGSYTLNPNDIILCISLGQPFGGYCYKLIASIINKNDSGTGG